ncbi:MAG: hypothetical protein WC120_00495 [Parcubacteria group bacterium]
MTDRYVDKQIKVLELICKNNFEEEAISSHALKITDNELEKILEEFQQSNLLKVQQKDLLNSSDEYRAYDDILIYYLVMNKDGLTNLLAELKKNHPRHDKSIIREKNLKKISKRFGGIITRAEIIESLQEWGVPKSLIEYQPTECEMIFSILNYYALSAKKEDYYVFAKIIEGLVQPFMFDGDRKEMEKTIDNFNCLIEDDNFVIKNGHLQRGRDDANSNIVVSRENSKNQHKNSYDGLINKDNLEPKTPRYSQRKTNLLEFFSDTGDISYKGEMNMVSTGTKGYALLQLLSKNKNTAFNIKEIQEFCNPLVNNTAHYFKKEKDMDDTLRLIKFKLKIGKHAFFPISKKSIKNEKQWIWVE